MHKYTPRRCSKRWLDGDCPKEVLAIIDAGPNEPVPERYDVLYAAVQDCGDYGTWMNGASISERGAGSHFELRAHEIAAYRYRMKHRYARWTDLPEPVRAFVRRDLEELVEP